MKQFINTMTSRARSASMTGLMRAKNNSKTLGKGILDVIGTDIGSTINVSMRGMEKAAHPYTAIAGLTAGLGLMAHTSAKKTADSILEGLYPGNMLPTSRGKIGTRVSGSTPSPLQGVKFNYRRK
jgi:hypothetical protein